MSDTETALAAAGGQPPTRPLQDAIVYFTNGMNAVRGFLTPGSASGLLTLLEIQRRDAIRGPMAEIGTFHGKSLIGFGLAAMPDEPVLGVDLFVHGGQDFEAALRGNWQRSGLPEDRLLLHRGSSTDLDATRWSALLGAPARLVHVDGEHTRRACLHDLGLAASCLALGGAIVVDDVLHPWYPDITLAVGDFLAARPEFRMFALIDRMADMMLGGAKAFIVRGEDVARYSDAFRYCMPGNIVCEAAFAGSSPLVFAFKDGVRKRLLPIPPG